LRRNIAASDIFSQKLADVGKDFSAIYPGHIFFINLSKFILIELFKHNCRQNYTFTKIVFGCFGCQRAALTGFGLLRASDNKILRIFNFTSRELDLFFNIA
jgi:hypothetical protein